MNLYGEKLPDVRLIIAHVVGLGTDDIGIIEIIILICLQLEVGVYLPYHRGHKSAEIEIAVRFKREISKGVEHADRNDGDIGVELIHLLQNCAVVFGELLICLCKCLRKRCDELRHLPHRLTVLDELSEGHAHVAALVQVILDILERFAFRILRGQYPEAAEQRE